MTDDEIRNVLIPDDLPQFYPGMGNAVQMHKAVLEAFSGFSVNLCEYNPKLCRLRYTITNGYESTDFDVYYSSDVNDAPTLDQSEVEFTRKSLTYHARRVAPLCALTVPENLEDVLSTTFSNLDNQISLLTDNLGIIDDTIKLVNDFFAKRELPLTVQHGDRYPNVMSDVSVQITADGTDIEEVAVPVTTTGHVNKHTLTTLIAATGHRLYMRHIMRKMIAD